MRRLPSIPLVARVPLIAAGLMILFGVFASHQVLTALTRFQEQKLRELAQVQLNGLAVAALPAVIHQDVWEAYDTLDRAAHASKGMRTTLLVIGDAQGKVLAASDPRQAPVGQPMALLTANATPVNDLRLPSGADSIRVVAPIMYHAETIGTIAAELDVRDLTRERQRAATVLLAVNILATLLLAGGGAVLMGRMLRPLATLAHHMGTSDGVPQAIPEDQIPSGRTELSRLLHNYNAMVDEVHARGDAERRLAARERFVSLGRLSSSLAHEINNPLGGLLNSVDTIRSYADDPGVVRKSAELLDRGLRHLRDVARTTLEQNRIDRSGVPASRDDFEDLRLLIGPEIRRGSQSLSWSIGASEAALARVPSQHLRQISLNLLLNASSAADKGGDVGLGVEEDGSGLRLRVSDSGPGLSGAARHRLLSSDPVPPGGGVGLRLVHDLVQELDGQIALRRVNGQSVIEIVLPCGQEARRLC